jgi:hypothetical protein
MTDKRSWHPITYVTPEDLKRNTVTVADCFAPDKPPHPRCPLHGKKDATR